MIRCTPKSIFSWSFNATGLSSGPASITYNWFTEQGQITSSHTDFAVRKHGVFSGRWTLEHNGQIMAEAIKPSAMFRRFEITAPGLRFTLQAQSPITRTFDICIGDRVAGRISPAHLFTRRTIIDCHESIPEHSQLFAFWLVGLTWRRAAKNNSNSS